jgi:hypothetical protein
MTHIFMLTWFFVTAADGNQIMHQFFSSQQACEEMGAYMNTISAAALAAKKITTFGGDCQEVPNSNNGST